MVRRPKCAALESMLRRRQLGVTLAWPWGCWFLGPLWRRLDYPAPRNDKVRRTFRKCAALEPMLRRRNCLQSSQP